MIAGHFGLAAAVKAREPSTPLWALMLATQWLDVVFTPLFATGIEGLEPLPGIAPGAYGGALIHADYSHSLVGALVLSAVFGAVCSLRYRRRSGLVLAGVAFSHWLLDLVVHHGDMVILPGGIGGLPRLGLGAWKHPVLAAGIEAALVIVGAAMYWRAATRLQPGEGASARLAKLSGVGVLVGCAFALALNLAGF